MSSLELREVKSESSQKSGLDKTSPPEQQLWAAVESGNIEKVRKVEKEELDKGDREEWGRTALHKAAWRGCPEMVAVLLEMGAEVDSEDVGRRTPLHCAAWKGHMEVRGRQTGTIF